MILLSKVTTNLKLFVEGTESKVSDTWNMLVVIVAPSEGEVMCILRSDEEDDRTINVTSYV